MVSRKMMILALSNEKQMALRKIFRYWIHVNSVMSVLLISNNTDFLVQFGITVEPPVTTTSPQQPVSYNTKNHYIWNLL